MLINTINNCKVIQLQKIYFREGNITPIEGLKNLPFEIKRVFYLYDIPGGESRGAHAHKKCQQFLIAASGSFEVKVEDGENNKIFYLNQPYYGLYIPFGIWANQQNFSSGSVCLVMASEKYNEEEYIRDYQEYKKFIGKT